MGAIGEEELIKWENMQVSPSTCEEKILVCVRLRPLNEKEIARNEVSDWECINETTILYRNSLPERSMFPTVSTFDRVFSGECSTRKLYEEGTKEIALSVVSGINSSIFAYGQTSSGKTYTMIGITEYAVVDIYDYIQKHEERSFVLKFSAMEIYNEAVRDLLSTDTTPLRVLDDPEKGTIVEKLTEETLRDWDHLKELLSICEAQRQVGETPLNETSSRSHQILRLTIESCAREFLGKDNSTTLAASVNFVDLAGSERASQALSVGARLKEGCHINRSLLTLGTVIRKLSKGRHGHINYRDSKLTRILQPCLGGNARTAIICTLSPARSHAEQSRNTLLFASCAKEVTTNAQVNVVMSDKALVKHLQSELARLESEIRTPVPTSNCDYAALLRKKNLHIEKLEKEVRELTKQRDLAESRVEDLVQLVKIDQASRHGDQSSNHLSCQESDTWGEDSSVSESSGVANPQCPDIGVRKSKGTQTSKKDHRSSTHGVYPEDPRDICREVRCIEMDERDNDKISESVALPTNENERSVALRVPRNENVTDDKMASTPSRKVKHNNQNDSTYGVLKQKFRDVQKTIDSLVSPYPEEPSHWALEADMSYPRSFKLTSSRSCRDDLITGSSSPYSEMERQSQKTPPYGFEKSFPGRPEGFLRMLPALSFGANIARLSTSDSQSSFGSAFGDGLKAQSDKASADEENPSIDAFFAGLKEMTKLQYKKQPVDDQVQGTEPKAEESGKEINNVGLDPVQDSLEAPHSWPIEFERQQKMIIELWQTCNISLVHRTYFFLLFNGDPADSIYMEVELRRLSFLKESLSQRNRAVEDSRTLTLASSLKALRREREMLSRLMSKSFSEVERIRLYQKWGISLDSNRRKMQLVQHLWNNTKDMNHIMESASIVAKLIKFSEQVQALKEMFGLSFIPPSMNRRSFGRNRSVLSIL